VKPFKASPGDSQQTPVQRLHHLSPARQAARKE